MMGERILMLGSSQSSSRAIVGYIGDERYTQDCFKAVEVFLQTQWIPKRAKVVSFFKEPGQGEHAFLLTMEDDGDDVIVLPGFMSGYSGEGPRGLSRLISLLWWHEVELSEAIIDRKMMEKLKSHALTYDDIDQIRESRSRGNPRDYLDPRDILPSNPWHGRPVFMPLGTFDDRLIGSAVKIMSDRDNADAELFKAARTLENVVKHRASAIDNSLNKATATILYRKVFNENNPILMWDGLSKGEIEGRKQLFIGSAQAMRNPRVHSMPSDDYKRDVEELMLLNMLFRYEKDSIVNPSYVMGKSP